MKIVVNALFLTQKITGVQRYAVEISKELKKLFGDDIKFAAPKNIIHHELAEYLEADVTGNFTGLLWEQADLPFYLAKNKNPLLLNMRNTAPLFYSKNIVVLHDLIFMKKNYRFSKQFPSVYRFCTPFLLKNALKIITVSNFSKQDIIKTFNIESDKIEIVYNAVSKEFREHSDKNYENKDLSEKYLLCVASCLSPRKNLLNVVKAFNKTNVQDLKLVIVGEKSKHFSDENLLSEVKSNKNIVLTGYVSDSRLANLYKNAELFVFPSLYEGFGIPPLEAMSCGCPVIVSDVTALPEVCGDAAYYVNPHEVEKITSGINKILNDKDFKNDLINKGYEQVKKFDTEESVFKIKEIIENCFLKI